MKASATPHTYPCGGLQGPGSALSLTQSHRLFWRLYRRSCASCSNGRQTMIDQLGQWDGN